MPLDLTPIAHGELCYGWRWKITDEVDLAQKVALVALGQYRHVAKILSGIDRVRPSTRADTANGAISLLTVPTGQDSYHRDGWIFQTISWIAAHRASVGAVIRAPHAILAHKGFDGFQLRIDKKGKSVTAVVIFEDKATERPRETIKAEVWPGIKRLEAGERMPELIQETSALLVAHQGRFPTLDIDAAVENILWKEARYYRVSITAAQRHDEDKSRMKLFKGFDDVAPGARVRRCAETIYIPDLRIWMQQFANIAIAQIENWRDDV